MKSMRDMIAYYNTEVERDARFDAVEYILSHIRELDDLSLSDVARDTYVSKSTISRLVRRFGFEDYEQFLEESHRFVYQDQSVNLRVSLDECELVRDDPQLYIDSYVDSICDALIQLKETVSADSMERLMERMMAHETALFATEQPLMIARNVQTAFLIAGKLLQVGETKRKRAQIARDLPEGSLAVVLSNYGRYLEGNRAMFEDMRARGVSLCLVTLCYEGPTALVFDEVIRLSRDGFSPVGSYPMKAFFDVLARRLLVASSVAHP